MTTGLQALAGRRVLLLNWRDLSHPRAGGAEVYCQAVAERFAAAGAEVTLFTSQHPGAASTELHEGVRIVRQGGTFGVYARAAAWLLRRRRDVDLVVDFQNGIPFFAPLFAGRRCAVVLLIHHVHQQQFALHFPWPASRVGQLLEGPVSRLVYRRRPLVAVSPSTRQDVRRTLRLRGPVHVVPNGLTAPVRRFERRPSSFPHVVVVSRLVSHKRFHLLLEAVQRLLPTRPDLQVDVVGDGPERETLQRLATRLGLDEHVRFHGFAPAETRDSLLASAWLTVSPSQAEGWGLTVVEANAVGVPAVGFAVPGLRDSVVDGVTGWLVPEGDDLSAGVDRALTALADPQQADDVARRCRDWAARFSWDTTAERLAAVGAAELDRARSLPRTRRLPTDLATRVDFRVPQVPRPAGTNGTGRTSPLDGSRRIEGHTVRLRHDGPAAIGTLIRRSDQRTVDGDLVRLVLHGCDEAGAETVLRRLGARQVERVSLATTAELLVGAVE